MTLHGDRVTCDCCGKARPAMWVGYGRIRRAWCLWRSRGWTLRPYVIRDGVHDICPACRASYTDDQLRAMLAQPKETT